MMEGIILLFRTTSLILSAILLGGCAAPLRVTLTPDQRASITELDSRVIVVQDEVIVDVKAPNSSAAGAAGGLIGALIVSSIDSAVTNSRVKSSQDLMGPFYAAIEDIDFRKEFYEAVRPGLANYPIKVASVTTTPLGLSNAELRKWRDALQPGQCLLIIVPRYTLSADFRTFDAQTIVTIWKKDGEDRPINRGALHYQSAPTGPGNKDSIAQWSANDAAAFRAVVKEAVAETMLLVRADLDALGTTGEMRNFSFNNGAQQTTLKGRLVSETATRVVVLGADDKLHSLPKPAAVATN
jgi:hypothetical protein